LALPILKHSAQRELPRRTSNLGVDVQLEILDGRTARDRLKIDDG